MAEKREEREKKSNPIISLFSDARDQCICGDKEEGRRMEKRERREDSFLGGRQVFPVFAYGTHDV